VTPLACALSVLVSPHSRLLFLSPDLAWYYVFLPLMIGAGFMTCNVLCMYYFTLRDRR
jgi:hypothetical protein